MQSVLLCECSVLYFIWKLVYSTSHQLGNSKALILVWEHRGKVKKAFIKSEQEPEASIPPKPEYCMPPHFHKIYNFPYFRKTYKFSTIFVKFTFFA